MTDVTASGSPDVHPRAHLEPPLTAAGARPSWSVWRLVLLLVLWIVAHPYVGIVHDARYYTLQALQTAQRGAFSDDLFFRYGSQDSYSIFSALYGPVVGWLGPGQAHLWAYVAGQLAWISALVWLLRVLFEPQAALLAAVGATLLDAHYGSAAVFQYGEIFVTPRLFSEALVLCALALLFGGRGGARLIGSALCLIAAASVHPLMAIAGMGTFAVEVGRRIWLSCPPARRASLTGALVVVAALAAVALVAGPLGRARATFDKDWFDIVVERSAYAFLGRWAFADWLQLLVTFATLATGVAVLPRQRWALAAVTLTAAVGILFGFAAGDIGRNVLVVDLQLWRTLWLATLLANAALAALIACSRAGALCRELIWGAVLVGFTSHFAPVNALVRCIPIVVALGVFWFEQSGRRLPAVARVIAGLAAALCLGWGMMMAVFTSLSTGWSWAPQAAAAAAALLLLAAPASWPLGGAGLRLAFASGLAVLALARDDARSDWQRFTEASGVPEGLGGVAHAGGGIYWEGDPTFVWVKLRRPVFYACEQGTGAMFYRGTAVEFARMSAALKRLNTADFGANGQRYCPAKADPAAFGPTASAVIEACADNPQLDLLILNQPVVGLAGRYWRAPVSKEVMTGQGRRRIGGFSIYSCTQLRSNSGAKAFK